MSHHVEIQSRSGNVALGVVGVIYLLGAIGTLLWYVMASWGAAGLLDRLLQLALVGSAVAGAAFLVIAADNLHITARLRGRTPPDSPARRRAAAA
jgi:membrane protein implicated in regulation of membrane protease activity